MTVRDIFDLRKQGRIEEAYEAIKPMYAVHKGKYTTLCMFWTARDVFNLRMQQGRFEEAEKIFRALQRVLPNIDDTEGNATAFMQYAARALASIAPSASPAATAPAGSPAVPPAPSGSPTVTVPAGSPAVPPAPSGSAVATVSAAFAAAPPAPSGSPTATVPAAFAAVPPAPSGSPAATVPAAFAAVPPAAPPAPHLGSAILLLPWGQKKVLDCIKTYPGISVPRLSASTRIPAKSIERHIAALIDKKLIEHRGSKKTGGYYPL